MFAFYDVEIILQNINFFFVVLLFTILFPHDSSQLSKTIPLQNTDILKKKNKKKLAFRL